MLGGNILAESNTSGQFSTEYLYSGSSRIAMAKPATNKYYFFQNDHLGTPRTVIDENNVVVWEAMWRPFGEALPHEASTIENNLRFPGQYYDEETGFHQNWHRDYDPSTGRYLEADPIGLDGGVNLYGYAGANPVMKKDRKGLDFDEFPRPYPGPSVTQIDVEMRQLSKLNNAIVVEVSSLSCEVACHLAISYAAGPVLHPLISSLGKIGSKVEMVGIGVVCYKICHPVAKCVEEYLDEREEATMREKIKNYYRQY